MSDNGSLSAMAAGARTLDRRPLPELLAAGRPVVLTHVPPQQELAQADLFEPVLSVIGDGAETSILLALMTMVWIVLFGVPIGILSATRHGERKPKKTPKKHRKEKPKETPKRQRRENSKEKSSTRRARKWRENGGRSRQNEESSTPKESRRSRKRRREQER